VTWRFDMRGRCIALVVAAVLLLIPYRVMAHAGGAVPEDLWRHWNLDLLLLIGLLLPLYLYSRGAMTYPVARWRTVLFVTAIATLFIALISPLDALSNSLFSAHMVQHLLLILIAAPLLVVSRPLSPLLRGLPQRWRNAFGSLMQIPFAQLIWARLTGAIVVLLIHLVALLMWHVPGLYSAAINHHWIHILEHASFFITAALYWWVLYNADHFGGRIFSVFIVMMASGLLGALMTFASVPWYPDHAPYVAAWGLTPLEDQQLAGLFMWIPAGTLYVAIMALLLGTWLSGIERRMDEREGRPVKDVHNA
jgi:putative membrane protein